MTAKTAPRYAIVLPAGGARAAYQVGVLKALSEKFPQFQPRIFTGISAGSINSTFLAQGAPFPEACDELYHLWEKLEFKQVFETNFGSIASIFLRWTYDLFLSKFTHRLLMRSILDATPLAVTLLENIHFPRISSAVRQGIIDGVAVTATDYQLGQSTVFFDSSDAIEPWVREQRRGVRTPLRARHIMASCSIPILFEPVRIGDYLFGDGSLRFNFPFSPALRMGATHIVAVGIRSAHPVNPLEPRKDRVGMGFVAGAVLNSIFLDSIEVDYENIQRINRHRGDRETRTIRAFLQKPSRDLGALARSHMGEVPFHLRQVLGSTAKTAELGDLLSYLLFSPGYLKSLLELGEADGAASAQQFAEVMEL